MLKDKILNKQAKIAVIGIGYVGLPLGILFAEKGFTTYGLDIDPQKIKLLKEGKGYIKHIEAAKIKKLVKAKLLIPSTDFSQLKKIDCVLICVPTPLTPYNTPDLSFVLNTVRVISRYLHKEELVILESTTYPGTTDEEVMPILEKVGLRAGKDFYLAFSPEREDPGNKKYSTRTIPKVVGGVNPASTRIASLLYEQVVERVIPVSSSRVAEATKLLENIYRAVNIALVNELKLLFDRMGINIWEVIETSRTKPFGFMPFYPGPGLGGHCIPIDPFYLSYKAKEYGFSTRFIELAGEINTAMPEYVVSRVIDALNQQDKNLKGAKILLLGIAYKKDVDDIRESPALEIMQLLKQKGAVVSYHDPFIPSIPPMRKYSFKKKSARLNKQILHQSDCVVIVTDHSQIDYQLVAENANLIVDTRNALKEYAIKFSQKIVKA